MDPMDPMDCFTKDVQWMSTFSLQQVQALMKHDKTLSLKTSNIMKPKWDGSHNRMSFGKKVRNVLNVYEYVLNMVGSGNDKI